MTVASPSGSRNVISDSASLRNRYLAISPITSGNLHPLNNLTACPTKSFIFAKWLSFSSLSRCLLVQYFTTLGVSKSYRSNMLSVWRWVVINYYQQFFSSLQPRMLQNLRDGRSRHIVLIQAAADEMLALLRYFNLFPKGELP